MQKLIAILITSMAVATLSACNDKPLDKSDPANSVDCKSLSVHERSPGNNCIAGTESNDK